MKKVFILIIFLIVFFIGTTVDILAMNNIDHAIKELYPNIDDTTYRLQDDGGGAYIAIWNVLDGNNKAIQKPTLAELKAVELVAVKKIRIASFKKYAQKELGLFLSETIRYRDQKEHIGTNTDIDSTQYQALLQQKEDIRIKFKNKKTQINNSFDLAEVQAIDW